MKKYLYYITLLSFFLLSACSSSNTYPSMQEKYKDKLAQIHTQMTVAEVKKILPIRVHGAAKGNQAVYVLRDTAGIHQTFSDKMTSIAGIRAESMPVKRTMYFYFKHGKLTHWGQ